ncbi:MAG: methyl-accepting chemotaxis protein [Beijerinckiaceae bacterium]
MALPADVVVGLEIFRIPQDLEGLRQRRRIWKYLAPRLPEAIDRHIDDMIKHVPPLKEALMRDRQAYRDLVFRHTESLFTVPLSEKHLAEAKERAKFESMLRYDMRGRATISQSVVECLVEGLKHSRFVSKRAVLEMIELATRMLAMDTVGSIARHNQVRAHDAKTKAIELGEAIHQFSQTIQAGRGLATTSVASLGETAAEFTELARHGADQAETAARAADDTAANVALMADATEELSVSINHIRQQTTASAGMAYDLVKQNIQANERMVSLSQAVDRIGSVVGLISDIAASTNMLALNATIEASRAGDAGRGFAVVAAEVKSLARQTSQATQEIGKQIATIQEAARSSLERIDLRTQAIKQIANIADAVAASVDQQAGATGSIAAGVNGAARSATTVAEALRTIEDTVGRARDASRAALDLSKRLAENARDSGLAMDTLFKAAAKQEGVPTMTLLHKIAS